MHSHHEESIQKASAFFRQDPEVEALLLGGSIAHGFEAPNSDIDVMILVSDQIYRKRLEEGRIHYYSNQWCSYEGGYVDGKYICMEFLNQVARRGGEPARFAFQDARVLFSRGAAPEAQLRAIVRYPVEGKEERLRRFHAQFEAWNWYAHEALRLSNRYLLGVSAGKLVLFGGRMILAHNELLYPYHKWLMRVLERAQDKPSDLSVKIDALYAVPGVESIRGFYESIRGFFSWTEKETGWPNQFMMDSELNWQTGTVCIDDI